MDAFKRDDILQENIIMTWREEGSRPRSVSSQLNGSKDFHRTTKPEDWRGSILDMRSFDKVLHIPHPPLKEYLKRFAHGQGVSMLPDFKYPPERLQPIAVPFLQEGACLKLTPLLLWHAHVKPMLLAWPSRSTKSIFSRYC